MEAKNLFISGEIYSFTQTYFFENKVEITNIRILKRTAKRIEVEFLNGLQPGFVKDYKIFVDIFGAEYFIPFGKRIGKKGDNTIYCCSREGGKCFPPVKI